MNTTKNTTSINGTEIGPKTEPKHGNESKPKNGSSASEPCTTIVSQGTTEEQSATRKIKSPEKKRTVITAGVVSFDGIPQAVSKEIHTYGGLISEIMIQRMGGDDYAISLLIRTLKAGTRAASGAGTKSSP